MGGGDRRPAPSWWGETKGPSPGLPQMTVHVICFLCVSCRAPGGGSWRLRVPACCSSGESGTAEAEAETVQVLKKGHERPKGAPEA